MRQAPRRAFTLNLGSHSIALGTQTKIMGIINMTPDSFSHDGCLVKKNDALSLAVKRALRLVKERADIIDIGGESTRPGSRPITAQEESKRVIPLIQTLQGKIKIPLSIDTYKEEVAKRALDEGVSVINNIMGTKITKKFINMIKNYDAAIVLMHIKGTPRTMQQNISYKHLIPKIGAQLKISIEKCLECGIKSDKIIIDPGIGFGKTLEDNLSILNRLDYFTQLNCPLLIGTSRKSFIGKILNKEPQHRLNGTIASVCVAINNGAHIVRVHDVKPVREAVEVADAILNERSYSGH